MATKKQQRRTLHACQGPRSWGRSRRFRRGRRAAGAQAAIAHGQAAWRRPRPAAAQCPPGGPEGDPVRRAVLRGAALHPLGGKSSQATQVMFSVWMFAMFWVIGMWTERGRGSATSNSRSKPARERGGTAGGPAPAGQPTGRTATWSPAREPRRRSWSIPARSPSRVVAALRPSGAGRRGDPDHARPSRPPRRRHGRGRGHRRRGVDASRRGRRAAHLRRRRRTSPITWWTAVRRCRSPGSSFGTIAVPGHSPASIAYHADGLRVLRRRALRGIGRPHRPRRRQTTHAACEHRGHDRMLPPETVVLPGHGPATTLEARAGDQPVPGRVACDERGLPGAPRHARLVPGDAVGARRLA